MEGGLRRTSVRHGTFNKISAAEGEEDRVCLNEESVGSNEVRGVDTLAGGEDGMEGKARE